MNITANNTRCSKFIIQGKDDILIKIEKHLTKAVKDNMCIASYERKQSQAKIRIHIKKFLKLFIKKYSLTSIIVNFI